MNIYIFGLGHIGLPLACWLALTEENNKVIGIDINEVNINKIKNGTINIEEYYKGTHLASLAKGLIDSGKLSVNTEFNRIDKLNSVFILCIGMADRLDGTKDLAPILTAIDTIKSTISDGDLIILRSTLVPGTCENYIIPRLKQAEKQFYFAYCPETIIETRAFEELENNELIIGAIDEESFMTAKNFFESISHCSITRSPDIKTAELAKVIQNIHRDVNIALANEISDIASQLNVDFYELQKLVNKNPRVELLAAGPGVGGYCLPNALGYLQLALSESGSNNLIITKLARKLNTERPSKVFELVQKALNNNHKTVEGSVIAVTGLAMKDYCADCRISPALDLIALLKKHGAIVKTFDPLVQDDYPFKAVSFEECIRNADCLVIMAKQEALKYPYDLLTKYLKDPPIIVDTRNVVGNNPDIKLYRL
ncbi:MAG: nucleotide sugar dehydrogenase [Bacillota bacterium]|nr:nucleotide sugar dehydrogenase [Bacillota bacterium]